MSWIGENRRRGKGFDSDTRLDLTRPVSYAPCQVKPKLHVIKDPAVLENIPSYIS